MDNNFSFMWSLKVVYMFENRKVCAELWDKGEFFFGRNYAQNFFFDMCQKSIKNSYMHRKGNGKSLDKIFL